jgi:hypothetical protein
VKSEEKQTTYRREKREKRRRDKRNRTINLADKLKLTQANLT